MLRISVIVLFLVLLKNVGADDLLEGDSADDEEQKDPVTEPYVMEQASVIEDDGIESNVSVSDIHETMLTALSNIAEIEKAMKEAEERREKEKENDYGKIFQAMVETLLDIINLVQDSKNALTVLNSNGFEEFVLPNLKIENFNVRKQLLILTKTLFDVAPETTISVIPIEMIDKLIDILELDESLAIKEYIIDVLYAWLPRNPKAQARVIIYKGLEPFYYQIYTLEPSSIYKLLDLFNKILREHKEVRSQTIQSSKEELDKLRLYQRIGLLERLRTPDVCDGILRIIETAWVYNTKENNILIPVFELMGHVKETCMDTFRGKPTAIAIFKEIQNYIADFENRYFYEQFNVNMEKVQEVVETYVTGLNVQKERIEL